jgi:xylose isomerase
MSGAATNPNPEVFALAALSLRNYDVDPAHLGDFSREARYAVT